MCWYKNSQINAHEVRESSSPESQFVYSLSVICHLVQPCTVSPAKTFLQVETALVLLPTPSWRTQGLVPHKCSKTFILQRERCVLALLGFLEFPYLACTLMMLGAAGSCHYCLRGAGLHRAVLCYALLYKAAFHSGGGGENWYWRLESCSGSAARWRGYVFLESRS